jgi:hypothetical protein
MSKRKSKVSQPKAQTKPLKTPARKIANPPLSGRYSRRAGKSGRLPKPE